jgi:preprotein translocase subunit YajC
MPEFWSLLAPLFAQDAGAGGGNGLASLLTFMLPLFAGVYLLIILPQQQQEKKRRKMMAAIKKNDRVLTAAGIFGVVVAVDPAQDRLTIRVDDEKGVKLAITKSSVVQVLATDKEKDKEKE